MVPGRKGGEIDESGEPGSGLVIALRILGEIPVCLVYPIWGIVVYDYLGNTSDEYQAFVAGRGKQDLFFIRLIPLHD